MDQQPLSSPLTGAKPPTPERPPAWPPAPRLVRWWVAGEAHLERIVGRDGHLLAWSGPLAVACLLLVALSGLYLFLFYQPGATAGYASVQAIDQAPFGLWLRSLHRYAARAFLLFSLLHLLRYLVTGRFQGPRWVPWVTGLALLALAWVVGLTGYLLLWDTRAWIAALALARLLDQGLPLGQPLAASLSVGEALHDNVFFILLYLHITLPLLGLLLGLLHLSRLNRPRLLPPPHPGLVAGSGLLLLAWRWPVQPLPPADPLLLPAGVPLDPLFLGPLAALATPSWAGPIGLVIGLALVGLPWLRRPRPRFTLQLAPDRCTGCGRCVVDCPFQAIDLASDSAHPRAVITSDHCLACGICLGACPTDALRLGSLPDGLLAALAGAERAGVTLCLACAAAPVSERPDQWVLRLPCVGAVPASVARRLSALPVRVHIAVCGLETCLYREGGQHLVSRLRRERPPYWPQSVARRVLKEMLPGPATRGRLLLSRLVAAGLLSLIVGVSRWDGPLWWPPAPALLKVVVRTEAPFRWQRTLTAEERERLLPHMRTDRPISGERQTLWLSLDLEGQVIRLPLPPRGVRRDGLTYGYLELPLTPGSLTLALSLRTEEGRPLLAWETTFTVAPRAVRVLLITSEGVVLR